MRPFLSGHDYHSLHLENSRLRFAAEATGNDARGAVVWQPYADLPHVFADGERARRVVDLAEERLLTPLGLRSLDPSHRDYRSRYEGDVWQRDGSYHQGTVWPWLIGPFVEAWVRVRGNTSEAKREANRRFVEPLLEHLNEAGLRKAAEAEVVKKWVAAPNCGAPLASKIS